MCMYVTLWLGVGLCATHLLRLGGTLSALLECPGTFITFTLFACTNFAKMFLSITSFLSLLSLFKNPNLSLFALVKTFFAREDPLLVVFIRQTLISEGKSKRN